MSYTRRKPNPNVQQFVFTFRLYPKKKQHPVLWQNSGCKLVIWQYFLKRSNYLYETTGHRPTYDENSRHLTHVLKKDPEYAWLTQAESTVLQQTLKDLDNAFQRFFEDTSGFPNFKKFNRSRRSFRTMMSNQLDCKRSRIKIGKLGWFKVEGSWQDLADNDKIKNITTKVDGGKWYCVVLVERPKVESTHEHPYHILGNDLGVVNPVTSSYLNESGEYVELPNNGREIADKIRKLEKLLAHNQRQFERMKIGSKNRKKQLAKINRIHYKIRMLRKEFREQFTNTTSKMFKHIAFEDLDLANMTKSAKGTVEAPGTNVAAKSGLNHGLLLMALGALVTRQEQKSKQRGGEVLLVNPRFTSQTCHKCNHKSKANRKSQSEFVCGSCGYEENADFNASCNVGIRGQKLLDKRLTA